MKPNIASVALTLLVAGMSLAVYRPAPAQPAAPDPRLDRRFSMEVRSAPLADVAAQLAKTLNVTLAVDEPLADQRVTLRAPDATLADFIQVTNRLFSARWEASGTGEATTYRLRPGTIEASADRLTRDRRALFLQQLQGIASALGRQAIDQYVTDFRQRLAAAHPDLSEAALAPVTADYLRQALLLAPLGGTARTQLAQSRFLTLPISSLTPAQQQLVYQFAAASFSSGNAVASPEATSSSGEQMAYTILGLNNARVEYRIVYGDAWSDLVLVIRAGIPDHWATAMLTGILTGLPDARTLQQYPEPAGDDLARRITSPVSLSGLNADEAVDALAQAAGLKVATDSFARPAIFRPGGQDSLTGLTLREALDTVAESYGLFWWKQGDWYYVRHRLWPEERRVMVRDSLLRQLGAGVQGGARAGYLRDSGGGGPGRLDAATIGLLTSLNDERLLTLNLMGTARGGPTAPVSALNLNDIDVVQRGLDFYRGLIPGQQNLAASTGLSFVDMSPQQRTDFAALAWDYGYIVSPVDPSPFIQVTPSFPNPAPAGGPLDGMLLVKFGFGSGTTRAASLALRVIAPPAAATPPTTPTTPE